MLDLQEAYQRQSGNLLSDNWTNTSSDIPPGILTFTRGLGSLASHMDLPDFDFPETAWPGPAETSQGDCSSVASMPSNALSAEALRVDTP